MGAPGHAEQVGLAGFFGEAGLAGLAVQECIMKVVMGHGLRLEGHGLVLVQRFMAGSGRTGQPADGDADGQPELDEPATGAAQAAHQAM